MQKSKDTLIDHFGNTTIIISGFGDDPICEHIRSLAADHKDMETREMTCRPDAPVVQATRAKSRATLFIQSIVNRLTGLPKRKIGRQQIQPPHSVDH